MNLKRLVGGLVWAGSLSVLVLTCLLSPDFVERHLSSDGHILDQTRAVLALWRLVGACTAVVVMILWASRRRIVGHFSRYTTHRGQTPNETLSARDLMGKPQLGWLGKILWIVLPIWLVIVDVSFLRQIQWPRFLLGEYGVLENGQVLLYLTGGVCSLMAAFRRRGRDVPIGFQRWWMLLLCAFCFFVAGEEINWGQTYFQFRTPEAIERVNQQQEFSVHNLWIPAHLGLPQAHWDHLMGQMLGLLGAVGPWLLCLSKRLRCLVWTWEIPVPPLLAQGYFAAAVLIPTDALMFGPQDLMRPTEMREFSLGIAFAVWLYSERNRWKLYADTAASSGSSREQVCDVSTVSASR